jgi:DNA polymerase III subunit gamma/tau
LTYEIYEPLVTRYRPKILEDLVGQDDVVAQIQGMIATKRISRSYLIQGIYGSGKTTIARILARYLNCASPSADGHPCGTCKSCERMDKGNHPDVIEINAADARGIDDIRAIIATAIYKPQSNFRFYILDEVHQLTSQAMSSLLKLLEEPPASTIICLVTTNPEKLLDTIVSRCVQICISKVEIPACTYLLWKVATAEGCTQLADNEHILENIAKMTRAHPRNALQALEAVINHLKNPKNKSLPTDETLGKVLAGIVEKVVALPPWEMAIKYLCAVYTARYALSFRILKMSVDYDYFLRLSMELHTQVLLRAINPNLCDPQYTNFLKSLDVFKLKIEHQIAAKFLPIMVAAIAQAKTYLVDASSIAYALNVQLLDITEDAIKNGKVTYDAAKYAEIVNTLGVMS